MSVSLFLQAEAICYVSCVLLHVLAGMPGIQGPNFSLPNTYFSISLLVTNLAQIALS